MHFQGLWFRMREGPPGEKMLAPRKCQSLSTELTLMMKCNFCNNVSTFLSETFVFCNAESASSYQIPAQLRNSTNLTKLGNSKWRLTDMFSDELFNCLLRSCLVTVTSDKDIIAQ